MNPFETAFLLVALCMLVVGGILTAIFVYHRLVSKGYNPAVTFIAVLLLYLLSYVGPMAKFLPIEGGGGPMRPADLLLFVGPLVVLTPLGLLPVRVRRRHGARRSRVPFKLLGGLLIAFALLGFVGLLQNERPDRLKTWIDALSFGIATGGLGMLMFWYARRLAGRSLDEVLGADRRPHVLYLRAFLRDNDVFLPDAPDSLVHLKGGLLTRLNRLLIALNGSGNPAVHLSFEEFFAAELDTRVGPFVALGSPQDYLPPVGAVRAYARDADWQEKLARLVAGARLVIMEPDGSANVAWELKYLAQTGAFEKFVVVTRPLAAHPGRWNLQYAYVRFVRWARRIRLTPWSEFAAAMAGHGYGLDMPEPPPGSVIAFDDQRRGVLLVSGAAQPSEYVDVILAWLLRETA